MANVNVKLPKKLGAETQKLLSQALNDKELQKAVAETAIKEIQKSILQAKEPATGNKFAAPTITEKWRKRKRRLATVNPAFDSKSAGGSKLARLIFTGQFLQSFEWTRLRGGFNSFGQTVKALIEVQPNKDLRVPYRNLDGSVAGKPLTNRKLGEYLVEQGRDWTGLPENTRPRLVSLVRSYLRRLLRR